MESGNGPVALALTRQGVPVLDRSIFSPATGLSRGAYILMDAQDGRPDVILIGTGSEVHIAIDAARRLEEKGVGVRVVSMPSWELFEKQPEEYRLEVLPPHIEARIAIEAGVGQGWYRYVGGAGEVIGLDRFGASAPSKVLYEELGITSDRVLERASALIDPDKA